MQIVEQEIHNVEPIPPGSTPNYNKDNPARKLIQAVEAVELAAGREHYVADSLQYLFPFTRMGLYGPSGESWQIKDPRLQDNKNDFQKQNLRYFELGDTHIVRGYVHAANWTGPFLHVSYSPGPASPLRRGSGYYAGKLVRLYLNVGGQNTPGRVLSVPYNDVTHRYDLELWGYPGTDLRSVAGVKGQSAIDRGALLAATDVVKGSLDDFQGPRFDELRDKATQEGRGLEMFDIAVENTMHPIRPLAIEIAWADEREDVWDALNGQNYRYEFAMSVRGWRNYIGVGQSSNPHGGVGSLEYRNLYSNYFGYEERRRQVLGDGWMPELGREVNPWNFDAYARKPPEVNREAFMAVNYMDLHILKPDSAIGIHRHRDSLEAFLMLHGKAFMVIGDWCKFPGRERAFEIRTLQPGDLALIKGGQFHGLINLLDENSRLFMFGGYD
jgi:mannose-6-phosphate isomerase-like protein (cupin superfamily)